MISILTPTRGRPEHYKEMCLSALRTASNPGEIEFVSYHRNDDKSVYEFVGNHKEVYGDLENIPLKSNECHKVAQGPIYVLLGDSGRFETQGWDQRIKETFDQYPDKIVMVSPDNERWKIWGFGTIVILHQNWIDAAGYLNAPWPDAQSSDRWTNEVAVAINRRVHLLDVTVNQLNIRDRVHYEKNKKGRREQYTKRYWLPEMAELRRQEAERLQNYINTHK